MAWMKVIEYIETKDPIAENVDPLLTCIDARRYDSVGLLVDTSTTRNLVSTID